METFVELLIAAFAIVLFAVAVRLFLKSATAAATSAITFVFLFAVLLSVSKFRHFQGWGFDAETWDQTQVEAAVLVEHLKSMTEAMSGQVSLLASKLGIWDAGLTNPQLEDLLDQTKKILGEADISAAEQDAILEPIYHRIILNYCFAANEISSHALTQQLNSLQTARSAAITAHKLGDVSTLDKQISILNGDQQDLNKAEQTDANLGNIEALLMDMRSDERIGSDRDLLNQLNQIATDIAYFKTNHKLRRRIDWSYLYQ